MLRFAGALLSAVLLVGCAAPASLPPTPPAPSAATSPAPAGSSYLSELGFEFAPTGFTVPTESMITERIDMANNVTAVFASPSGLELAAYLREHLPAMGFEITADANQSLLFTNGTYDGAFTASGPSSALTLRTDRA